MSSVQHRFDFNAIDTALQSPANESKSWQRPAKIIMHHSIILLCKPESQSHSSAPSTAKASQPAHAFLHNGISMEDLGCTCFGLVNWLHSHYIVLTSHHYTCIIHS